MSTETTDDPSARVKLGVALVAGLAGGGVAFVLGAGRAAPLIGWDVLAAVFCAWTWAVTARRDAKDTAHHARQDDPRGELAELVLIGAALASLVGVGAVLFGTSLHKGDGKYWLAGLGVASVAMSWLLVHSIFTLKYARLYYAAPTGGIDFNEDDDPQYTDFAYLAFTIGMTFQVSDTNIQTKLIRRAALHQALLSYPLGVVVIASMINLVSNLA